MLCHFLVKANPRSGLEGLANQSLECESAGKADVEAFAKGNARPVQLFQPELRERRIIFSFAAIEDRDRPSTGPTAAPQKKR